jgi:hypothetical protein
MEKWKVSLLMDLILLVGTNICRLYSAIDAGVTFTYQQVTPDEKTKAVEMLAALVVKGGLQYTREGILQILR